MTRSKRVDRILNEKRYDLIKMRRQSSQRKQLQLLADH